MEQNMPRILIIEDTFDTLELLEFKLNESPFLCHYASNGETGLTMWREARASGRPYSLILLDIHLRGGRDGFSITREIRSSGDTVPIVYLTATSVSREEARARGAQDVWLKPRIMTENIGEKIAAALSPATSSFI